MFDSVGLEVICTYLVKYLSLQDCFCLAATCKFLWNIRHDLSVRRKYSLIDTIEEADIYLLMDYISRNKLTYHDEWSIYDINNFDDMNTFRISNTIFKQNPYVYQYRIKQDVPKQYLISDYVSIDNEEGDHPEDIDRSDFKHFDCVCERDDMSPLWTGKMKYVEKPEGYSTAEIVIEYDLCYIAQILFYIYNISVKDLEIFIEKYNLDRYIVYSGGEVKKIHRWSDCYQSGETCRCDSHRYRIPHNCNFTSKLFHNRFSGLTEYQIYFIYSFIQLKDTRHFISIFKENSRIVTTLLSMFNIKINSSKLNDIDKSMATYKIILNVIHYIPDDFEDILQSSNSISPFIVNNKFRFKIIDKYANESTKHILLALINLLKLKSGDSVRDMGNSRYKLLSPEKSKIYRSLIN